MPYVPPNSFHEHWRQLKGDLADSKADRLRPLFRFSLASFLVLSTLVGASIGWLGRLNLLLPGGAAFFSSLLGAACGLLAYLTWRRYGFTFRRAASENPAPDEPPPAQEIDPPS